jgi:hypothetical protein
MAGLRPTALVPSRGQYGLVARVRHGGRCGLQRYAGDISACGPGRPGEAEQAGLMAAEVQDRGDPFEGVLAGPRLRR